MTTIHLNHHGLGYADPHPRAVGAFLAVLRTRGLTDTGIAIDTGVVHGPAERPWVARDARTNRPISGPLTRSEAIDVVRGYCAAAYATPIGDAPTYREA